MKKITAVVRPEMLEAVKSALEEAGYPGMMLTRIDGHGKQGGKVEQFRGRQYKVSMLPKYKIEIICDYEQVESIIEAILGSAHTGEVGDGKIFISTIDEVIRIRTKERGAAAV